MYISSKTIAWFCLFSIMVSFSVISEESDSEWSVTIDAGTTKYDFRGASDVTDIYGIKIDKGLSKNFSIFISYQTTGDFYLTNVPRFEVDFIETSGVSVRGNYKDLSAGLTGRIEFEGIDFTGTIGYSNQKIYGVASIPSVGEFSVNNADRSYFLGIGLEYPLSRNWLLYLDIRNNELLTNSEVLSTTVGIEYLF